MNSVVTVEVLLARAHTHQGADARQGDHHCGVVASREDPQVSGMARAIPLYRNYDEFSAHVVQAVLEMIRGTRGSMVTFNAKKIALLMRALRPPGTELEIKPVTLTLVKDVLERLRERGYLEVLGENDHSVKYAVTRDSPLWRVAKNHGRVSALATAR